VKPYASAHAHYNNTTNASQNPYVVAAVFRNGQGFIPWFFRTLNTLVPVRTSRHTEVATSGDRILFHMYVPVLHTSPVSSVNFCRENAQEDEADVKTSLLRT
jgi:hypothetical protein